VVRLSGRVVNNGGQEVPMSEPLTRSCRASWGQMDFNAHMANTAHLDLAADTRLVHFEERGFSPRDFELARTENLELLPSSLRGTGGGP
jgi:hypothetical protein